MSRGDLGALLMFGRSVKPVPLGMMVLMATLATVSVVNAGELHGTVLGDLIGMTALGSFTMLGWGWVARSQSAVEAGLLLACATYVLRSSFIALTVGVSDQGVFLGLGAAIIAGGAYLLETWDDTHHLVEV